MHRLKFKAFAPVNRHEPHGVHVQRARRDLSEVSFFCEEDELPHAIERSLNSQSRSDWTLLAHEIEKLPDRQRRASDPEPIRVPRHLADQL